jgi:hypothetical protein
MNVMRLVPERGERERKRIDDNGGCYLVMLMREERSRRFSDWSSNSCRLVLRFCNH